MSRHVINLRLADKIGELLTLEKCLYIVFYGQVESESESESFYRMLHDRIQVEVHGETFDPVKKNKGRLVLHLLNFSSV